MEFTIAGRIKPYVRTTRRQKWADPQWAQYEASRTSIQLQIMAQMNQKKWIMLPEKTPVWVELTYITRKIWNHDIDNVLKAILDASQGYLFPDDRYVQKIGSVSCIQTTRPHSFAVLKVGELNDIFYSKKRTQDPDFGALPEIVSATYHNNP